MIRILELSGQAGGFCEVRTLVSLLRISILTSFPSIGTSDDDLGRMLEVLRFWFTKDLVCIVNRNLPSEDRPLMMRWAEIYQGKAVQTVQFDSWRIL
jgi:hypothetical protein